MILCVKEGENLWPLGFPPKTLSVPLASSMRATCPAYVIFLDFVIRKIFGDE